MYPLIISVCLEWADATNIVAHICIYTNYCNVIQLVERFLAMMERYSAKAQALLDASSNLAVKIICMNAENLLVRHLVNFLLVSVVGCNNPASVKTG